MSGRIHYPPVYLGIFLLLMTAVAAAMFAVAPPLPATLYTFIAGLIYAAGLHACRRYGDDYGAQLQQFATGGAVVALGLVIVGTSLSGVETGLILMLLALQAGRNLVLSTRRDLNFACLISLVLLLYAAGKAMAASFVVFIVLYALAGMFTFMSDHIDARLGLAQGGDRELLARRMNLPARGFGLALLTLSLAFLIYLLVPRPPSPGLQAFPASSSWDYDNRHWEAEARTQRRDGRGTEGDGYGEVNSSRRQLTEASPGQKVTAADYAGFKSRFDISRRGDLDVRPDGVVLNLQTDNPLYVRGKVFDSFDGRIWEHSGVGAGKTYDRQGRFSFGNRPKPGDVRQVFTVRQDLPPFIFAAYRPVLVSFPGSVIEADASLALRAPDRLRKGTVYSVASRLQEVDQHPCSGADNGDDVGRTPDNRYLALYDGISDRLRALAAEVTVGAADDLGRAKAVEAWLRGNYAYTLATVGVKWSGNPVEQFLFELKAGHCELFASSMVVMLRTLNIPARLVTGFYVNRYNPVTGYYEVMLSDGHAWVEAYLEHHGWVTFEPTSSFHLPRQRPKLFVAAGLVRYLGDRAEDLIRKDRESWWAKLLQGIMLALFKLWQFIKLISALLVMRCLLLWRWFMGGGWLAILLLFSATVSGWYLWQYLEPVWRLARLRRAVGGESGRFVALCYREMERHFRRRGKPRLPSVTPLEYEQLLCRRFPELAGQVALITRYFQQAAYGPEPLGPADAMRTLEAFTAIHGWRGPGATGRSSRPPPRNG
jgi:protein-glutamine gamma-glutamyltransferase